MKTKSNANKAHWCYWTLCTKPIFDFTIERLGYKQKIQHIIVVGLFFFFFPGHFVGLIIQVTMSVCPTVTTQTATTCIAVKSMLGSFKKICQQINFGLKSNNNRH